MDQPDRYNKTIIVRQRDIIREIEQDNYCQKKEKKFSFGQDNRQIYNRRARIDQLMP